MIVPLGTLGAIQLKVKVLEFEEIPPLFWCTMFTRVPFNVWVEAEFVTLSVPAVPLEMLTASNPKPNLPTPVFATVTLMVYVWPGMYPVAGMLSVIVTLPPPELSAKLVWQPLALQAVSPGPALRFAIPLPFDIIKRAITTSDKPVRILFFIFSDLVNHSIVPLRQTFERY